ncbi:hypothetical protein DRO37_00505 [Candidatus Bathyarchaeota archaeon]|nr:MAG: hypothetical protein DRO37_00505 [Candidatus Bathyarchaeota archaeon]
MVETIIREFVEGRDERAWIELHNEFKSYYYGSDYEPLDERGVEWFKRTPWWRESRLFIAEKDGEPVGFILPFIDKAYDPPKGYLWEFAVKPSLEGDEADSILLGKAISWLSSAGAREIQASARDNMLKRIRLYQSAGFKMIRTFSRMRLKPEEIRENIEACVEVELRTANPTHSCEDLKILNALCNMAFQEHFDFRPETLEETKAWLEEEGYENHVLIALIRGKPVGYVVATISDKPSRDRHKRGFISSIGILKPFRRRGIGTSLILEAIRWLSEKGAKSIELDVDDANPTGAPQFYAKIGFKATFKTLTYLKRL